MVLMYVTTVTVTAVVASLAFAVVVGFKTC